jgi:hypothetical protein
MTEQFKQDSPSVPTQAEPNVVALIKKMQQQLAFLEKKIDILINQSQGAPFREKRFSKPYRSFDRPQHHAREGYGERPRDGGFDRGRSRERDFGEGRHFEKRQDNESRGFVHKKKPFFQKRRDRG